MYHNVANARVVVERQGYKVTESGIEEWRRWLAAVEMELTRLGEGS